MDSMDYNTIRNCMVIRDDNKYLLIKDDDHWQTPMTSLGSNESVIDGARNLVVSMTGLDVNNVHLDKHNSLKDEGSGENIMVYFCTVYVDKHEINTDIVYEWVDDTHTLEVDSLTNNQLRW